MVSLACFIKVKPAPSAPSTRRSTLMRCERYGGVGNVLQDGLCTSLGRPLVWVRTAGLWAGGRSLKMKRSPRGSPARAADGASQKRTRHWRRVLVREETPGSISRFRRSIVCCSSHKPQVNPGSAGCHMPVDRQSAARRADVSSELHASGLTIPLAR